MTTPVDGPGAERPGKVAWLEWGEEAFGRALSEDKPVVLFITAPWCDPGHEMDRTTFTDPEIIELLHRDYVPIRVDSDRRPDINERYSLDGWPTTVFLTPRGSIIGGANAMSAQELKVPLVQLLGSYRKQRKEIEEEITRREEKIAAALAPRYTGLPELTPEVFRKTVRGIVATFDSIHAGFGRAPKFPMTASLRIVLQALAECGGQDFTTVLTRTLDAMGDRGMYDAVEGGFFHCATNDTWAAARFEKLGEDNAGLIPLYLDASLATGTDKYRERAVHAAAWVRARLCDPDRGVFYGSQAPDNDYYMAPAEERRKRKAPPVDRTVFTPVSAAMASAFLRLAQVTGETEPATLALRGLDWLLKECIREGRVAHYHDGEPHRFDLVRGPILLSTALLDAFDHTGEGRYLDRAGTLMADLLERFWSDGQKGLVDCVAGPRAIGELRQPRKIFRDNGMAAANLARMWRLTGNDARREEAERLLKAYPDLMDEYGHVSAEYALAADWLVQEPVETKTLREYVPRRVIHRAEG